jgi:hypothetical protein
MRARNGADESWVGREPSIGGTEAGDDWVYPIDGGSTGELSRGRTQAQDIDDCSTVSGQDGAGTTAIKEAPWFEPVEDNGCKDGVCPVPWLANTFLTEDRNSNFPGENTIPYRPELQPDLVNHPPHYTDGSIECIEAIEAQHTPEEYRGYLKGNIAKYIWRERHKGGTESLRKARFYLDRLIMFDEN